MRDRAGVKEMARGRPCLPNLLIIGAAKAGTTSLHSYLSEHPEVFMSKHKELSFLIRNAGGIWELSGTSRILMIASQSMAKPLPNIHAFQERWEFQSASATSWGRPSLSTS